MLNIPLYIKSKDEKFESKIPACLYQTFRDDTNVHEKVIQNINSILEKNPSFDYKLITDSEFIKILNIEFPTALPAFKKLKAGAAKGDFIRYILLYLYGGVYLDLDSCINININKYLHYDFVFIVDDAYNFIQWVFMTSPKCILLKYVIDEMIERITNNEQNIFLATGPTLITDVLFGLLLNKKLYHNSLSHQEKIKIIEDSKRNELFKNGLIIKEDSLEFLFTFNGYNRNMMYDNNNPRYIPVFGGGKSPDLYLS
jgi:mannosyltransferase OCH1-like enzyme